VLLSRVQSNRAEVGRAAAIQTTLTSVPAGWMRGLLRVSQHCVGIKELSTSLARPRMLAPSHARKSGRVDTTDATDLPV
jgi:hypothetical protein